MNLLLNFDEVQSWIEFLSATIYLVTSVYLIYLHVLNRRIPAREKKILRALSIGFFAISVVFIIRQVAHHSLPEAGFYQSELSIAMLMMLLVLPAQHYCSYRVGFHDPDLKIYILNILVMTTINIVVPAETAKVYLYIILTLFLLNNVLLFFKFCRRFSFLVNEEPSLIIRFKNDIFIFLSITVFSFILIALILFGFEYVYVRIVLSIFSFINLLLFVKVTIPYCSNNVTSLSCNDDLVSIQEERHRINRQLSDNIKADELYERLLKYFEKEKPYLKPDLKIKEVALYLYSNKTYLSRIINDKNNQNFNQFVNYYRIEEVKKLFTDNNKLNIQELCCLSGFGSMATFSIAFRFHMGYTPADWCKEQKLKTHHG